MCPVTLKKGSTFAKILLPYYREVFNNPQRYARSEDDDSERLDEAIELIMQIQAMCQQFLDRATVEVKDVE